MTVLDDVSRRLAPVLGERLIANPAPDSVHFFAPDDRVPALVARPVDAREVAAVVAAAAETGVPFAVRSTGHSYARHGVVADGLVLDLQLMNGVHIDAERRVGTAAGGATAGAYTTAAHEHGLATGFGDTGSVGVAGLTLGGGIGYLSRRDGLTIDNLLAAEVVLADSTIVRVSEQEQPDLFWALRGGGGNLGVVTSLELQLRETNVITGGLLIFEPSAATVAALLSAATQAPDEVSTMINIMKAPPVPFLPSERHGTPIVMALVCHSGRPEEAEAALAPFRGAGSLLADLVRPQPYPAMFGAAPSQAGMQSTIRAGFGFDKARAETAIELIRTAPTVAAVVNLRPMGGAIARVPADATAFAHRHHEVMTGVGALDPAAVGPDRSRDWVTEAADKLGITGPKYVNFVGENDPDAVRDAYPEPTLRRLAEVKRTYDPGNLFRSNVNVEPAAADAR
ncbi:MAG: FAD-binding oxidoreductase [Micromonosporaceae bacterium]|nr:FAD-binding oxidoreductase [Micromonosporaceae bacterium]